MTITSHARHEKLTKLATGGGAVKVRKAGRAGGTQRQDVLIRSAATRQQRAFAVHCHFPFIDGRYALSDRCTPSPPHPKDQMLHTFLIGTFRNHLQREGTTK